VTAAAGAPAGTAPADTAPPALNRRHRTVHRRTQRGAARCLRVRSSAVEELDRHIVELLVADGRMSYTDLGKATGLSTSAVHQRVRRLEQRGVIRGYAAIVDPEAVGLSLTAFISVKPFDPSAPDDIADRLAEVPEIEACHSVAGDENYILKVRVATPIELEHLLTRIRTLAGVSTRTTVVLSTAYESRPPRI
jgi:Lrp/AsnC family leucine-responsive transcriptional regulator